MYQWYQGGLHPRLALILHMLSGNIKPEAHSKNNVHGEVGSGRKTRHITLVFRCMGASISCRVREAQTICGARALPTPAL